MTKQTYKDRRRDPHPKNPPPKTQIREQNIKGRKAVDKPKKHSVAKATAAKKPRTAAQKRQRRLRDAARRAVSATGDREKVAAPPKVANTLLRVTDTQEGTIHEEAARLKLRQTEETSPVEVVTVEGNKVEVVARPEVVHPVELAPHRRDTVIKDRLRESDSHEETMIADGTSVTHTPDWHEYALKAEQASPQGKAVSGPISTAKKRKAA
jgi:hypothetical protein